MGASFEHSPSKHAVRLPHASFVGHLHVRPKQHAVHGPRNAKVVGLKPKQQSDLQNKTRFPSLKGVFNKISRCFFL